MLLEAFLDLTQGWRGVFVQPRLLPRAQHQALGGLLVLGRATLSRVSSGPIAASSTVGRRTTSFIPAPSGTLRRCSPRCLSKP